MDFSLTGSGSLLPVVIIGIIIGIIIVSVFFVQRLKKRQSHQPESDTSVSAPRHRLDYQPEVKPRPIIPPTVKPTPSAQAAAAVRPDDIDLVSTRKDLTESLVALSEKYSLDSFTLTTADGLVFGSSGGDTSQTDAAIYSGIFKNDPLIETPGVELFSLMHKGSELIGIIRTGTSIPENILNQIITDTNSILNWWI